MGCFAPLPATQSKTGGRPLIHPRLNYKLQPGDIKLPCGKCMGCRINTAQQWATRCHHQSQLSDQNSFATLTISTEALPTAAPGGSLSNRTHQTFVKRLRARTSHKISYYMCGEYGEKLGRPHYHYLIFGYDFSDKTYSHQTSAGEKLYTSELLQDLWPHGKAWLGTVTPESCAYVAAYVMKKMDGDKAIEHYRRQDEAGNDYWLTPEFHHMSRNPGIGKNWWMKYNRDVTVTDTVVRPGGPKMKPPRYYDQLLQRTDPTKWVLTKQAREIRARQLAGDNTPARLADKEAVTKAKLALKKRNLEQP